MASHVLSHIDGSTLYLTLNNAAKANSMSADMVDGIIRSFESVKENDQITAIVLTGAGKFFCTGMDLSVPGRQPLSQNTPQKQYETAIRLFESISNSPKTTIALVNGPCYGGGNGIAFACDIRIVVESATFTLSEVRRGLSPATISRYIVREWGTGLAREAMVTGRGVKPAELRAFGAVHYVVKDLEKGKRRLGEVLEGLRACAPRAIYQSKRLVNAVYEENSLESGKVIQDVFLDMTRPSEEFKYGASQFQKGVRVVDWPAWYASEGRVKL
jgi:hydroxymethylglutaryl-CoA lyase